MRRWSLTATFAVVSLLAMSAVGALLIVAIANQARSYAIAEAVRTAEAYVTAGVQDVATTASLTGRSELSFAEQGEIRRLTADPSDGLRAVRLWTVDSQVVFATDAREGLFPDGLRLDSALIGKPAPKVVGELGADGREESRSLSVYVPLYAAGEGEPVGAAEIVLDYSDTEAAVADAVRLVAVLVAGGLVLLWILLFRTVSNASRRLRSHATENARLALLDPLTGLPNRRLLAERIDRAAIAAARSGQPMGLLLLDVDGFKEINDTLGHDYGDRLLIEVGRRVRGIARETDTVSRLGGDEFAVLMPVLRNVEDAAALARRVLEVFGVAFDLDGITLHVDASIGVALLPDHAEDQLTLMRHADVAMYAAKRAKLGYVVYSVEGDHHSPQRLTLMGDLRVALSSEDQLALHYQPKVDLFTGRVAGLEALMRWSHPVTGDISPVDFIPLAEQTGMVSDLTQWVLEQAVRQLHDWERERAGVPMHLAVNLSARNLHEADLPERVRQLLHDARVSPGCLELEITESAIPGDAGRAQDAMRALSEHGVHLAVDDFGIGNTSISQLRSYPLRTVKIDRSFIQPLMSDADSIVLVRAIIDLAHEFDLLTVAEGVEDAETAAVLRELGCDLAQGFLWSPAVAAGDLLEVVRAIDEASTTWVTSGSGRTARPRRQP
ncbi:MAG: EAL domain-containing protein [Actinomycetota bacterium]|nr:EAL domain-containing protein [Actinomycetota bacterium]